MVESTPARERVLEAAEKLFASKGYTAVTLRDIAAEVGIKHASLYHHVPGGKEEIFIEVTERNFKRHKEGLSQAMKGAKSDVRSQLRAVADWLLAQPPMDLIRMAYSDMPAIPESEALRLGDLAYQSLLQPIENLLRQAQEQGEIQNEDVGVVAGGLLGMIESLHSIPAYALTKKRQKMAYDLIDVMLSGLKPR